MAAIVVGVMAYVIVDLISTTSNSNELDPEIGFDTIKGPPSIEIKESMKKSVTKKSSEDKLN